MRPKALYMDSILQNILNVIDSCHCKNMGLVLLKEHVTHSITEHMTS